MSAIPLYVVDDGEPTTLADIVDGNTDAEGACVIEEADLERLRGLRVGEAHVLGGGAFAEIAITRTE